MHVARPLRLLFEQRSTTQSLAEGTPALLALTLALSRRFNEATLISLSLILHNLTVISCFHDIVCTLRSIEIRKVACLFTFIVTH